MREREGERGPRQKGGEPNMKRARGKGHTWPCMRSHDMRACVHRVYTALLRKTRRSARAGEDSWNGRVGSDSRLVSSGASRGCAAPERMARLMK